MLDQAKLLKQAWDMKKQMEKIQKELKKREIVIQRDSVTVTITGDQNIKEIKLDPTVKQMENIKELESAIKNAVYQAIADSQEMAQKELQAVTGGMDIPGMPGL